MRLKYIKDPDINIIIQGLEAKQYWLEELVGD